MNHDAGIADQPVVFLSMNALTEVQEGLMPDVLNSTRTQLLELASVVTLGLIYEGSRAHTRATLQMAGLYDLFGDITLANGVHEIPGILRMLSRPTTPGGTFLVGANSERKLWPDTFTYVPGLSLIYGALAGQDIVIASLEYRGKLPTNALTRLLRSSVVPVFRDSTGKSEQFIAYLCEGSQEHLELAGFKVTELGDAGLVNSTDLYQQARSIKSHNLSRYQLYANETTEILAIPPHEIEKMQTSLRKDLELLLPDARLFSNLLQSTNHSPQN